MDFFRLLGRQIAIDANHKANACPFTAIFGALSQEA